MCPIEFQWRPELGGHALYFESRKIATLTALEDGRCRVNTRPDRRGQRYAFFATYATGRRYVETWACKWEEQIKAEGSEPMMLYGGCTMRTPALGTVETTHRRRARHRR
ncbi:hypothetical protein FQY83_03080 [Luteimonas marina]|uniref:Uncharacterized protein n=1 Tax=Luteimonas marina TaxID=488485 RepID=A0A5C5UCR1_9GAMM|nr:hypothetical protein [Luteimonas marina]TWT23627.1 hypothetical protein FQY83_03080 [Luteimonas marina]